MNILRLRWLALAFAVLTMTSLLPSCFVGGGGYYDGGDVGAAYYEPSGVVYGGWGPDYQVTPFRGGDHPSGGGHAPARACRSAPATRSMPSVPSNSRSGSSRAR